MQILLIRTVFFPHVITDPDLSMTNENARGVCFLPVQEIQALSLCSDTSGGSDCDDDAVISAPIAEVAACPEADDSDDSLGIINDDDG